MKPKRRYVIEMKEKQVVDEVVFVYAMSDPRDSSVFYVGSTINLNARMSQHRKSPVTSKDVRKKLDELDEVGVEVEVSVLEETNFDNRDEREQFWIGKLRDDGEPLVNKYGASQKKSSLGRLRWKWIMKEFDRRIRERMEVAGEDYSEAFVKVKSPQLSQSQFMDMWNSGEINI